MTHKDTKKYRKTKIQRDKTTERQKGRKKDSKILAIVGRCSGVGVKTGLNVK
jgi:hypothetical protein